MNALQRVWKAIKEPVPCGCKDKTLQPATIHLHVSPTESIPLTTSEYRDFNAGQLYTAQAQTELLKQVLLAMLIGALIALALRNIINVVSSRL